MPKSLPALLLLSLAASASHADNCDTLRAQIDSKIRAGGMANFTLTVVDEGTAATGKVVGTCARGTRRIVYLPGVAAARAAASAPARAAAKPLLTECKDGSVSVGGNCGR